MKIGFFGGCFNPPSNVHIDLAKHLLEKNYIDRIIFVPVGNFYAKKDLIKAEHRFNMIKLAIKGFKNIEVDNIEITYNKKLFASDAFRIISNKYLDDDIFFIMGSDNFEKMPTWNNYKELKESYKYLVINRDNNKNLQLNENVTYIEKFNFINTSSTDIRMKIANNEDVSNVLSNDVYKYILKNKLYII